MLRGRARFLRGCHPRFDNLWNLWAWSGAQMLSRDEVLAVVASSDGGSPSLPL
jgi:hypothetical protein